MLHYSLLLLHLRPIGVLTSSLEVYPMTEGAIVC